MPNEDPLQQLALKLAAKARDPDLDGYKPLAHQVEFHSDPSGGRINFGGNRSGKSYSSVCEMVWWATGTHPYRNTPRPPLSLRHVAVDRPQGIDKVLKELYKKIVPPRYLRGGNWDSAWQNTPPVLYFDNGSFIEFLTYEQELDKHAGTSRHAIAFDEEPDEAIFNENMARLIDTNGEWWIAMTPVEGLTWVYHRFYLKWEEGELDENTGIHIFLTDNNSYLPSGAFDRLLGDLSPEEKEARRTGKFVALSGLIFPYDSSQYVRELEPQPYYLTIASMDSGWRAPTSWLWLQITSEGEVCVVKEHVGNNMTVRQHVDAIRLIEASNRLLVPKYRVGDPSIFNKSPTDGQSVGTEYANYDIHIGKANNDVDAGLLRMAQLFEDNRLFIDKNCRGLLKELRTYRWDEWATRKAETSKEAKTKPKKKDDHSIDALRYGVMSRPLYDSGKGPIVPRVDMDPTIRWAEPYKRDHRDSGAYDDYLGSEW